MPKATPLDPSIVEAPQITPRASTPPRAPKPTAPEKTEQMPLQIRVPRHEVKAIKVAAAEREQTVSEFMLACFHAYMQA